MTRPEASRLLSLYSPEAWLQNAWQMRAHRQERAIAGSIVCVQGVE
jgi:hypothetical protein